MANKRAYDLTQDPTLSFDTFIASDKSGYVEALGYSTRTLLRSKVVQELDDSGASSQTLDFTDYNLINLTIDRDYSALITGFEDHEEVWLRVDKGSDDVFSISNPTGDVIRPSSVQKGLTTLFYRITQIKYTDSSSTKTLVEPMIRQLTETLSLSDFSASAGTVTALDFGEITINNDMLHFEASFTYSGDAGGLTSDTISITSNVGYIKNTSAAGALFTSSLLGSALLSYASASEKLLSLRFSETVDSGDSHQIVISVDAKIE